MRLEQHVILHHFLALVFPELGCRLDFLHQIFDERHWVVIDSVHYPPGRGHVLGLFDSERYLVGQTVLPEHLREFPLGSSLMIVGLVRSEPPFERGVLLERAIEVRPSAILHRLPRGPDNLVGDGIHCVGQPLRESTEPVYWRLN